MSESDSDREIDIQVDADYGDNCIRTKDAELRFTDEFGQPIEVLGARMDEGPCVDLRDPNGREIRVWIAPNFEGLVTDGDGVETSDIASTDTERCEDLRTDGGEDRGFCYECERHAPVSHLARRPVHVEHDDEPGYEVLDLPVCRSCRLRREGQPCPDCGEMHWSAEDALLCCDPGEPLVPDGGTAVDADRSAPFWSIKPHRSVIRDIDQMRDNLDELESIVREAEWVELGGRGWVDLERVTRLCDAVERSMPHIQEAIEELVDDPDDGQEESA